MGKQILTLIIGILLGAIIATGIFIALEINYPREDEVSTDYETEILTDEN